MRTKRTILVAVAAAGFAVVATSATVAIADTGEANGAIDCVLREDAPMKCEEYDGEMSPEDFGARSATIYQHPKFRGDQFNLALPAGEDGCSEPTSDTDDKSNIYHGAWWDNRMSSVKTFNNCDIKLYDHHNQKPGGGSTGWIHRCSRLSQIEHDCAGVSGNWDNRASSMRIS